MSRKDASFWSEIKSLDERLKRDPDSFCFARLSEVYLKVGLAADALHTARTGVARHPGYLAGQKALALACNANGLHDESRALLATVTAVMPEDVEAQKVYASLCFQAGDSVSAIKAYETVLDFRPDDVQSKLQIEALQHGEAPEPVTVAEAVPGMSDVEEDEEYILDLDEADIIEDEETGEEPAAEPVATMPPHHDPLSTLTLAELYEQQGFASKALGIYRSILADDPGNDQLRERIARLEQGALDEAAVAVVSAEEAEGGEEVDATSESADFAPTAELPTDAFDAAEVAVESVLSAGEEPFAEEAVLEEPAVEEPVVEELAVEEPDAEEPVAHEQVFETSAAITEIPAMGGLTALPLSADFAPLAHKEADNAVETLESWLENIRRIKACR